MIWHGFRLGWLGCFQSNPYWESNQFIKICKGGFPENCDILFEWPVTCFSALFALFSKTAALSVQVSPPTDTSDT
jgi:hypothetical protein